jgi:hypothetical protein
MAVSVAMIRENERRSCRRRGGVWTIQTARDWSAGLASSACRGARCLSAPGQRNELKTAHKDMISAFASLSWCLSVSCEPSCGLGEGLSTPLLGACTAVLKEGETGPGVEGWGRPSDAGTAPSSLEEDRVPVCKA